MTSLVPRSAELFAEIAASLRPRFAAAGGAGDGDAPADARLVQGAGA